tara:strand:- start:3 stop:779 length:777 start_codon:yes stop_codon:yes gene_type:complete
MVTFTPLVDTCGEWSGDPLEPTTGYLGMDLDGSSLWVYSEEDGTWGEYVGNGSVEDDTYVGTYEAASYYVDKNGNGAYDEGEELSTNDVSILTWTVTNPVCGDDVCEMGEPGWCDEDCEGITLTPPLNGTYYDTFDFSDDAPEGYEDCSSMYHLKPSSVEVPECVDCDFTWAVEWRRLFSLCGDAVNDITGELSYLGYSFEDNRLWIYQEGAWAQFGSEAKDDASFSSEFEAEYCLTVDVPCPAGYEYTMSGSYMLDW